MVDVTPQQMARRIKAFGNELSTTGMSRACAAGLREARKQARKRNFGFRDRTGNTRRRIGKVRRYRPRTVRRYGAGGAYFRGGAKTALYLEFHNSGENAFLIESSRLTRNAQFNSLTRAGQREVEKASRRARRSRGFRFTL